ncbi:MAG: hypothetical protein GEV28_32790 [Actinophytocola sp.]|uniref:hypothetical protein n=1 Tax=Actinophytocola sp. TaxID=1872138 RepID=UPI0013298ED1|nr:hypothetical protein [Actinophytocola sp.]MPZ84905.1 hypothetical protein [Actinophytocola sp.]
MSARLRTNPREVNDMGLFDIVKDKAAELFSGASEKVSELTGVELPGAEAADTADNAADTAVDTAQSVTDTATGAAQDVTDAASDAVDNVTGDVTGDATDPHRGE